MGIPAAGGVGLSDHRSAKPKTTETTAKPAIQILHRLEVILTPSNAGGERPPPTVTVDRTTHPRTAASVERRSGAAVRLHRSQACVCALLISSHHLRRSSTT